MQTYFEIAGHIVELENFSQEVFGDRTPRESSARTRNVKQVLKTAQISYDLAKDLSSDSEVTWHQVGLVLGLGVGITQAVLTSPLTLVDGVLPIADAAWWAVNAKTTQRYMFTGGKIGSYVDEHTDVRPGDFQRRTLDDALLG